MLDGATSVSLDLLMAVVAVLIPVGAGFVALWFRIDNRFAQQREEREALFAEERAERKVLDDKLDDLRDRVNREFVSHGTLQRTEDRLIVAIERLDNRLAEVVGRVDSAITAITARFGGGE